MEEFKFIQVIEVDGNMLFDDGGTDTHLLGITEEGHVYIWVKAERNWLRFDNA
jgi:hypothetical protein